MSGELQLQTSPIQADLTVKAIIRNSASQVWQTTTSSFVTFVDVGINNYGVLMVEQGTSSGFYVGDFPAITRAGVYSVVVYKQTGGSLVVSDAVIGQGAVFWDGLAEVSPTNISMVKLFSGVVGTDDDDLLTFLLGAAYRAVDNYLHTSVLSSDFYEIRNGEDQDYIKTWNRPINSIEEIIFDLNDVGEETVDGDNFIYDAATGIIKFKPSSTSRRVFSKGFQNIALTYNGGYDEDDIPDDIRLAYCKVVDALFKQSKNSDLISKKKVGDVLIEWFDVLSPIQISLNDPIFAEVRTLLAPYRNRRL